jgi:hypothetical protein
MDTAVVSALAAVLGSLVGGFTTVATAWVTQRTQSRRDLLNAEIRKREALFTEFITELSRLAIDALDHHLENPDKVFVVYALQNRIRLLSTPPVVEAADQALGRVLTQYFGPNLSRDEMKDLALSRQGDPLKPFSEACRKELADLRKGIGWGAAYQN